MAWSGCKPEVTHFRIFGSRALARIPSEKRKALDPQSTACIFVGYFDDVKGYKLIDPSTNQLFIEQSVQFEEIPLHEPLESHVETFVPLHAPNIRDDESTHSDHDSNLISKFDGEHEHEYADPHPFSPKRTMILREIYAQTTPQDAGDLVGDPVDPRTWYQFEDPSHALTATEPVIPMHCYMVLSSDPQAYVEAAGNPLWEDAM